MKKIAILTSGGDSPGMNTAIYELVKESYKNKIKIYGIKNGYYGLYNNLFIKLNPNKIKFFENIGGTFLKSARFPEFKDEKIREKAIQNLIKKKIDTLFIIGGDGSYQGAEKLSEMKFRCICLPGTIDNNINGTDYTIGYFTALENVCNSIEKIKDTASSHQRIFIIEIMGNTCGNLTKYSGIATGADIIITPKNDNNHTINNIKNSIVKKLNKKINSAIILITENITNITKLAKKLSKKFKREIKTTILGHTQRGGNPNFLDKILARRMAHYAINFYLNKTESAKIGIKKDKIISY